MQASGWDAVSLSQEQCTASAMPSPYAVDYHHPSIMDHRKQGPPRQSTAPAAFTTRRRSELALLNREQREALLRSKRTRVDPASGAELPGISLREAVASLEHAFKVGPAAILKAVRQLRQRLSGPSTSSQDMLRGSVVPLLVRVLLMRQVGDEARAAALEASWAVTNLAALEHDVEALAPTAPLLVAHLNRASGCAVSEQCAWALGNMAGDCGSAAAAVAASGAVLPLARLLLRAAAHCPCRPAVVSAAHTAAWALSNLLWGFPTQAGPLLDVPGFRDGLVVVLKRQHDVHLQEELAWLLAFLCAGPEAHMHAVVKHGAAEAVVASFVTAVQQAEASGVRPSEALLAPLLRCMGNMASSKAAAVHLTSKECIAATTRCAGMTHSGLRGEALWVLDNIAVAAAAG